MSIRDRLKQYIRDTFLIDEVGDDESFLESGVIDSLGLAQLVSFVELELGSKVPDTDLIPEHFDSIRRIATYVDKVRRAAA